MMKSNGYTATNTFSIAPVLDTPLFIGLPSAAFLLIIAYQKQKEK